MPTLSPDRDGRWLRDRLQMVRGCKNYYRRVLKAIGQRTISRQYKGMDQIFYKGTKGLTLQWTTRNGVKADVARRMLLSMIAYLEKEEAWLKA